MIPGPLCFSSTSVLGNARVAGPEGPVSPRTRAAFSVSTGRTTRSGHSQQEVHRQRRGTCRWGQEEEITVRSYLCILAEEELDDGAAPRSD
jgi:hypothetical protein